MGCNGTVGLSAGRRVAGGDSFWLRPVRPDGRLPRPQPELEFTLYAPVTSGAQGGQDAAGRRLTFLLMWGKVAMISCGVEISIAGGVVVMVCVPSLGPSFFSFFFFVIMRYLF